MPAAAEMRIVSDKVLPPASGGWLGFWVWRRTVQQQQPAQSQRHALTTEQTVLHSDNRDRSVQSADFRLHVRHQCLLAIPARRCVRSRDGKEGRRQQRDRRSRRRSDGQLMIIGLNLPNYSRLGYRESIVAIAQKAEALGYASLWTNDHVLVPTSRPEPFGNVLESLTTLSYLAASTNHIQLGTGILVLPQRDPLLVAKQAATISHLSGGRLALAVGVGYIQEEYAYLRADFRNRGHLADEYIAAMRELFESDTPEFHGPHINYADVLFSPRPSPRIPILVGGDSPAALKRAATLGDGWYGLWRSPDQVRAAIAQISRFGPKAP